MFLLQVVQEAHAVMRALCNLKPIFGVDFLADGDSCKPGGALGSKVVIPPPSGFVLHGCDFMTSHCHQ